MVQQTFDLADFELFLLILTRIATFMFVAPFFNTRGLPNMAKVGLAAILSVLVLSVLHPEAMTYSTAFGFGFMAAKEAVLGGLLGYAANICNYIVMFAGNLIDMDIGLSMASEFDPNFNVQVTITGNIYNQFILLFLVVSNMYQYLIRSVVDTFEIIPLGGAVFRSDVLLEGMILFMTDLFVLAFRIMMPIFAAMLIVNCILGVMAKVAPQMNMFAIGVQIKVIAGLLIMFVMVFLFPEIVEMIFGEMRIEMKNVLDGLHT